MRKFSNHPNIELVPTGSLKPNPKNPRVHSDRQIKLICASIRKFGFLVPLVVDEANLIAAGHARWLAAKEMGLEEVPTIRARFLSEADHRAFALAENRLPELSSWDEDLLAEELDKLFNEGFDLELTGFTTADLDFSLPEKEAKPEKVELPAPDAIAVSRPGDLWLIGPHRIWCGDAREAACYEALLGEERATMVFADPPYNVPVNGFVSGTGQHREFCMAVGELDQGQFTGFLRAIFRMLARFSVPGSIHYISMDWRHMRELLDASDGVYTEHKQLLIWDKGVGGMGTFYRSQHELVAVFKSGTGKHINNFGLGDSGRYRTNVVRYAGANAFRKGRKRDLADHSTVKPTALIADLMLDCSNRGDLILDPCLGSGSTLLAAYRTGRRGAGIEIDPIYVDTALARLADASRLTPVLAATGQTFAEVAAERAPGKED
ncbi:ParB N-terminal domain-containing protein [Novosphingobium flavum]|uniref:Methyltransferase n=1 Tax=Novosphingobium flavum TaxID=1778672 RepID=A0A7X1KNG3_9SPHN|nr:DNA methyltransferase [Novosphingobium flavum]MBC2667335.1 ParB N-terminal domain-containing protein [Novosphingobium flavum]